jgi:hypothetical protein
MSVFETTAAIINDIAGLVFMNLAKNNNDQTQSHAQ